MKILYAIQGTGNGHLSRARDIIPLLQQRGDLDILISGTQAEVQLPHEIKYRFKGLGFVFGEKGGIDLWKTYRKSSLRNVFKEINLLPIEQYDLVINDFEPVSAWACYLKNKTCFALSHQAAVIGKHAPKPKSFDFVGKAILKNYAPADIRYGLHFCAYDKNTFTPVIRQEVRHLIPEKKGHFTVYLPAYSDKRIISILSQFPDTKWQVFSKHAEKKYAEHNISVFPISNHDFMVSLAGADGILCGAGFETPAEALFLGKKLMVIPMKQQVEQQCNAAALKDMGIPVIKSLKSKYKINISDWLTSAPVITVRYPDRTEEIIDEIFRIHRSGLRQAPIIPGKNARSVSELRKLSLKKILVQLAG